MTTSHYSHFFRETTLPLPEEGVNKQWAVPNSSSLYTIDGWGAPYFFVNAEGNMAVRPHGKDTSPSEEIDIMMVVQKVVGSRVVGGLGLTSPLIMRFPDVLRDRLHKLQSAFDSSVRIQNYEGRFLGVFPVKCNQDRFVVENIVEFGKPYGFGLEAGSKPELLLAMASLCKGSPDALLICNGYKDTDYLCVALMARRLQLNSVIVLEEAEELDIVLTMCQRLCIEPVIGLRAKLNTKHAGHFGETSGENGKFGLSYSEIVQIFHKLRSVGMLGCLQLLHFHIGSQIPSLTILKDGVSEAAHIYCELALMGANMKFIDIGGGLGIDYDGSNCAKSDMSVGYTMEEYAEEVVQAVKNACAMKKVKQPTLCSESGRALVSHHSVLAFDVLSAHEKGGGKVARDMGVPLEVEGLPEELSTLQRSLMGYARETDYESILECAKQLKLEAIDMFKKGKLSLMQVAKINSIYEVVSTLVDESTSKKMWAAMPSSLSSKQKNNIEKTTTYNAIYHVNLSIFKSMPDTWAIGQLFPIVPLHRLNEEPKMRAILSDLTCDSDGKIGSFVGRDICGKRMNYLPVHELQQGKPYFMGMFLGGAYQEALGSMHNMFGTPPVVQVSRKGASYSITKASNGQTSADVLRCMHHEPTSMLQCLKLQVQKSLAEGNFEDDPNSAIKVIDTIASTFASPTYLSTNNLHPNSLVTSANSVRPKLVIMSS